MISCDDVTDACLAQVGLTPKNLAHLEFLGFPGTGHRRLRLWLGSQALAS